MNPGIENTNRFFFIGIAGTGMSAIAQYLKGIGKEVSGSDRYFGEGEKMLIQKQLESQDINCYKQDGSGIDKNTGIVVVSTAVETNNVEYQKALRLGIPVIKRSTILAGIANNKKTIAVGGTSGKSTTAAMIFHIMQKQGYSPSLITGAGLSSLQEKGLPGNAWVGDSEWLVIEADESDGSIVGYKPETGLVLNIDRDHKEMDELLSLFTVFQKNTKSTFIVNADHPHTKKLSVNSGLDFGESKKAGIRAVGFKQDGYRISFEINRVPFVIQAIGEHNMENAMAATAASCSAGIDITHAAAALESYQGIYRRTQFVGEKNGIPVIDDFAHNPAEVAAAIRACQQIGNRVIAWFQPHGFGPLKFMFKELVERVATVLHKNDIFLTSEVYYAGGTVDKDIQSDALATAVMNSGKQAVYKHDRKELFRDIIKNVKQGDVLLLMGARDPSLADFAVQVFGMLKERLGD
jgi:UDP-N-acetylmuramate--alanine ligase